MTENKKAEPIKVECNKSHFAEKMWKEGDPRTVASLDHIEPSTRKFWTEVKEFSKHKETEAAKPIALSTLAAAQEDEEEGLLSSKEAPSAERLAIWGDFEQIGALFDKRWGIKRLNKEYKKAVKKQG